MSQDKTGSYDIAALPGDGVGREVMPPAIDALEAVGRRHGFGFRWEECDWSCDRFLKTGAMMPRDGVEQVRRKDAIMPASDRPACGEAFACRLPTDSRRILISIIVRECNEGEYS